MVKKNGLEYDLEYICNKMLDNADMTIDLSTYPDIRLSFLVFGSVDNKFWEIHFTIKKSLNLKIESDDDAEHNDLFVALEVKVDSKKKSETDIGMQARKLDPSDTLYFISVYGDLPIEIVCCDFKWKLNELTSEEYKNRYE